MTGTTSWTLREAAASRAKERREDEQKRAADACSYAEKMAVRVLQGACESAGIALGTGDALTSKLIRVMWEGDESVGITRRAYASVEVDGCTFTHRAGHLRIVVPCASCGAVRDIGPATLRVYDLAELHYTLEALEIAPGEHGALCDKCGLDSYEKQEAEAARSTRVDPGSAGQLATLEDLIREIVRDEIATHEEVRGAL